MTIRDCNGLIVPIQITTKNNVDVKRTIRNDKNNNHPGKIRDKNPKIFPFNGLGSEQKLFI